MSTDLTGQKFGHVRKNTMIRQVRVLGHNDNGTIHVVALNGKIAGVEYDVPREELR